MRNATLIFLGPAVLLLALPAASPAAFIRVDPTGGGDATTVQGGMLLASPGDTVAVRHGLHLVANVELVDGVQLLGGWDDSFSSRIPGTSTLNANGPRALQCTSGQGLDTRIDGFEITGATDSAILCTASSATITNNEFHANSAIDGGAIHCEHGARPVIEDNHIHHNTANYGAGIRGHWGFDTSPVIRNNLIEFNNAYLGGGGISVNNGSPVIEHNVIRFNTSLYGESATGGGIHVWHAEGGVVEIRWNLIVHNSAVEGGGIGITGGHPIIENNTLWANASPRGGAIYQEESTAPDPGTTQVSNNILGGSPQGHAVYCVDDPAMNLDCNDLFANAGGTYFGCPPGATDLFLDPLFCDKAGEDFHLTVGSPCAPPGPTGCGLIGAYDVGCGPVSLKPATWAEIKARYR